MGNFLKKLPLDKLLCFAIALLITDGYLYIGMIAQLIDIELGGYVDWDREIFKALTGLGNTREIHNMFALFGLRGGLFTLALAFLVGFTLTKIIINKLAVVILENIIYKYMKENTLVEGLSYNGPLEAVIKSKIEQLPLSGDLKRYLYAKLTNIFVTNGLDKALV
ncbi:MAG: hypothetical protein FWE37_01930 [Spirochaetaceae bacterium]|nr:hypothetical protein [Spirochaetaceae bacterium]